MVNYNGMDFGYGKRRTKKEIEALLSGRTRNLEERLLYSMRRELPDAFDKYSRITLVDEDSAVGGLESKVMSNYTTEDGESYILLSRDAASTLSDLMSQDNPRRELYDGIRMLFDHEEGHLINGPSERKAQSYAMRVSRDVPGSLSATVAILSRITGEAPGKVAEECAELWDVGKLGECVPLAEKLYTETLARRR